MALYAWFFHLPMGKKFRTQPLDCMQSGRHLLFCSGGKWKVMTCHWLRNFRDLLKISVDNYILPGTHLGTEILWLYMAQWKRDLLVIASMTRQVIGSRCTVPEVEGVISRNPSHEPE